MPRQLHNTQIYLSMYGYKTHIVTYAKDSKNTCPYHVADGCITSSYVVPKV